MKVAVTGIWMFRFAGGKIVESWNNWDCLGMLQQLGVVPAMSSTRTIRLFPVSAMKMWP